MKRLVTWLASFVVLVLMVGGIPAAAQSSEEPVTYSLSEYADSVRLLGRTVVTDRGIVPHTTGAGVAFYSECRGDITLTVTGSCDKFNEQYFSVFVDGEPQERAVLTKVAGEVTQTLTVAADLEAGMHRIEIVRDTEEVYAECVFEDITLNGTLSPVAESAMLIEFVGDSLTCGYASNDRTAQNATLSVEHPAIEVGTQAFAYLTAQTLGADFQSVCASGYGVVTGWNGDGVTLPDMYDYASYYHGREEWSFARTADIVVINLGTNDHTRKAATGVSEDEIVRGIKEFMQQVKEKNPDAKVVWVSGMVGTFFEDGILQSIDDLGGAQAGYYYCELPYGTSGGAGHPSLDEHATAAAALAEFLKDTVLPEDYDDALVTVEEAQKLVDKGKLSEENAARLQLEIDMASAHPDRMTGKLTGLYESLGGSAQSGHTLTLAISIVGAVVIAALVAFAILYKPKTK